MKTHHKYNIISIFITFTIISLLILSGPASAIDVLLDTPNVDVSTELTKEFTIQIKINNNEFLPILYTDLIFDNNLTCKIDKNDTITGCDFLKIKSREISNLYSDYGYGYGYGYTPERKVSILSEEGKYGYQEFGYGYGYGYRNEQGYGLITYTLTIDVLKLPKEFIGKEINVEAIVYGGNENDYAFFKGKNSFEVSESLINERPSQETTIDITKPNIINYENVILDIPSDILPADATKIIVKRTNPLANPINTNIKILGKTYDFDVDSLTKTFSDFITITLEYTDEELTLAGITDESRIIPAYYDTSLNDWVGITSNLVIDTLNNKISFKVNHFTQFTLVADTSTITTSPIGGGGNDYTRTIITPRPSVLETQETPLTEEKPSETKPTEIQPTTPMTGFAIFDNLEKHPVIAVIIIIVILGLIVFAYFFFRKRKTSV